MASEILILAAFSPELNPLRKLLADDKRIRFGEVGVGLAQAAVNTTRLLIEQRPERVLFVGSVGTSDLEIPLLKLITATAVELADSALIRQHSFVPDIYRTQHDSDLQFLRRLTEIAAAPILIAKCYTPIAISSSADLGIEYGRATQAHFENLELFGVASACVEHNVPWNSLSAVTNYVGPSGHDEWKQNHLRAADETAVALKQALEAMQQNGTRASESSAVNARS